MKTVSAASSWLCMYEGLSEIIWTGAAVLANKKLLDSRGNYWIV